MIIHAGFDYLPNKERVMIKNAQRAILSVVLLVVSAGNIFSQEQLGPSRLVRFQAPALRNSTHLARGLRQARFLGQIGGVAFDAEAKPAEGFNVTNLSLSYDPNQPDGKRLRISFDGREIAAPILDWRLIPTARFADSEFYSCVTLFGALNDADDGTKALWQGGQIINYHDEFVDTLIGLRLFQLDMLILDEIAADLPKRKNDGYVLGADEVKPDVELNRKGFSRFHAYLQQLQQQTGEEYRSYVIHDFGSDIRFGTSGNSLFLTGDPQYFFWKPSGYSSDVEVKISQELRTAARKRQFSTRQWFISQLIERAREFEKDYDSEALFDDLPFLYEEGFIDSLRELLALKADLERKKYLQRQPTAALRSLLINLRQTMEDEKPLSLNGMSRDVSSHLEMVRSINPAVWDTGVNVMRYAAFFRYCKRTSPQQWRSFITRIRQVREISDPVTTPTVIYPGK